MRKIFLIIICLLASLWGTKARAQATNIYITQSGSTSGSCTSGVQTPAFFNTAGNWGTGSGQIGPGTVVLICGTFTFAAGATSVFSFQGNGTSGHPVTLKWDTGAIVQAPYFSTSNGTPGAIETNGHNYVTIDGGTNGIVQNTANGTGLSYQQPSTLVDMSGSSNAQVKNLAQLNLYQRSGSDTAGCAANNDWCFNVRVTNGGSNVTVGPGNTFTWCDVCVYFPFSGGESNLRVTGNTFSHYNQAIEGGPTSSGSRTLTGISIDNNTATPSRDWDEPSNSYHHNFFHPFTGTAGSVYAGAMLVYNNKVVGDAGQHVSGVLTFIENNNSGTGGTMGPWYIFNNIVKKTNTDTPAGDGLVWEGYNTSNGYLLNNTLVDAQSSNPFVEFNMQGGGGWTMKNNIFETGGYYFSNNNSLVQPVADYDMYYSNPAGAEWTWAPGSGGFTTSFSSWKSFCACDSHAVNGTDPTLNGTTFVPGAAAVFGDDLTTLAGSLGIPALTSDINGNARGSGGTGTWTVGAVNYSSGTPATPTNVSIIVVGP